MNVFKIEKHIRRVGYNYGLPMWYIEFGLGVNYTATDLLKKLVSIGVVDKDWVLLRSGMDTLGIGGLVDMLSRVSVRTEVEAYGHHATPAWFPKATRWTILWDGTSHFNFNALRKGQDMLICETIDEEVLKLLESDLVDIGCVVDTPIDFTPSTRHVRWYKKEEQE